MKVAWLCPYPLNRIENIPVKYREKQDHPGTWIVTLSKDLAKRGDVELHIISEYTNIASSFHTVQDNIHFHMLRSGSAVPFLLKGYPSFVPLDVTSSFSKNRRLLREKLNEIKPDLVHAHGTEGPYGVTSVESGYPHLISIQGVMSKLKAINPNYRYRKNALLEEKVVKRGINFVAKTRFAAEFIKSVNPKANIYFDQVFFGRL